MKQLAHVGRAAGEWLMMRRILGDGAVEGAELRLGDRGEGESGGILQELLAPRWENRGVLARKIRLTEEFCRGCLCATAGAAIDKFLT